MDPSQSHILLGAVPCGSKLLPHMEQARSHQCMQWVCAHTCVLQYQYMQICCTSKVAHSGMYCLPDCPPEAGKRLSWEVSCPPERGDSAATARDSPAPAVT